MVLTSVFIAIMLPDMVLPWHPMSVFGLNIGYDGTITNVAPGYAAANAGIQDGDRVDLPTASQDVRAQIGFLYAGSGNPGKTLTFVVHHGATSRTVTLTSRVQQRSAADNVSDVVLIISGCLFALIASALVLLRPSRATWAFFVYGISTLGGSAYMLTLPFGLEAAAVGAQSLLSGVGIVAFIAFALRFPDDRLGAGMKYAEVTLLPLGAALALAVLYANAAPMVLGQPTAGLKHALDAVFSTCAVAGVATIVWKFLVSRAEERQRIKWVIFGLVIGFGVTTFYAWFVRNPTVLEYNLATSASVLFPIALAYAVVRHRVIDVNFLVSRTIVYGVITALVVTVFGVVDWFFNSYLSLTKAGTAAEIASAVGLGFWLKALHGRVDAFVDAVFFRRRHQAERRLFRLAKALPHATTIDAVQETLVERAADALELMSAAMFLKARSGDFERVRAVGWQDRGADFLAADDVLVLQLSAEQQPLSLAHADYHRDAMPGGNAHPTIAVPVAVRNELRAFVLYGPHRRGDDLDPDEIATLSALAAGASAALDHAEAARLRKQIEETASVVKEMEAMRMELNRLRAVIAT